MAHEYLSPGGVAERIGVASATVRGYAAHGRMPEPDARIWDGKTWLSAWKTETIDEWQATRPGRGNWKSSS